MLSPQVGVGNDVDKIALIALDRFRQSARYRQNYKLLKNVGVDEWIRRCDRSYNSVHEAEELAIYPKMRGYFNISRIKVDSATGWARDLLAENIVMPFIFRPTPEPQLSKNGRNQVKGMMYAQLKDQLAQAGIIASPEEVMAAGGGTLPKPVEDWLDSQKNSLMGAVLAEESRSAENVSKLAMRLGKDWMMKSNFVKAFVPMIRDVYQKPCGVICGPFPAKVRARTFAGNKYKTEYVDGLDFRHVPCDHAYFAPDSASARDGGWFVERCRRSRYDLINMMGFDGVIDSAIEKTLDEFKDGDALSWINSVLSNDWNMGVGYSGSTGGTQTSWQTNPHYGIESIIMQGMLSGRELGQANITGFDATEQFEVEIEVCGNRTIRAEVNKAPGGRSYASTGFGDDSGPWKVCIPMALYDTGARINRILFRRSQAIHQQSGAFYGVNAPAWDGPQATFDPFSKGFFNPGPGSDNGRPPVQMFQPQPTFGALYNELVNELYIADTETAIPRFDRDQSGRSEQFTATESSIRYASAVRRQKSVAANLDMDVIRIIGERLYEWLLERNPKLQVMGDAMIDASGIVGGLANNIQEARLVEALAPLTNAGAQGIVPMPFVQQMWRDYAEKIGTDMRSWPDPSEQDEIDSAIKGQATTNAGLQPNTVGAGATPQTGLVPVNSPQAMTGKPTGIGAQL